MTWLDRWSERNQARADERNRRLAADPHLLERRLAKVFLGIGAAYLAIAAMQLVLDDAVLAAFWLAMAALVGGLGFLFRRSIERRDASHGGSQTGES